MEEDTSSVEMLPIKAVTKEFKVHRSTLNRHLDEGEIEGAELRSGKWWLPLDVLEKKYTRRSVDPGHALRDEIDRLEAANHKLKMATESAEKAHSDILTVLDTQISELETAAGEKDKEIVRLKTLLETETGKLEESDNRLRIANGRNTSLQERIEKYELVKQEAKTLLTLKPGNSLTRNGRKIKKVLADLERNLAMVQREIESGGEADKAE